ncbi:MAG: hypothetical protein KME64_34455 [Scytonematopsis contorta HA4267-MV1]|jgi:hypothetical protein|nr:hypothetical protein [Scytonematopsis contorta HA4267-MV1]
MLQQLGNPSDPLSMATSNDPISIATSSILITLLFVIIFTATPPFRHKFHDTFEIGHRYLGLTSHPSSSLCSTSSTTPSSRTAPTK